jgi:hypothetical protein
MEKLNHSFKEIVAKPPVSSQFAPQGSSASKLAKNLVGDIRSRPIEDKLTALRYMWDKSYYTEAVMNLCGNRIEAAKIDYCSKSSEAEKRLAIIDFNNAVRSELMSYLPEYLRREYAQLDRLPTESAGSYEKKSKAMVEWLEKCSLAAEFTTPLTKPSKSYPTKTILENIFYAWGGVPLSKSAEDFASHFEAAKKKCCGSIIDFNNAVRSQLVSHLPSYLQQEYADLENCMESSDISYSDKKHTFLTWAGNAIQRINDSNKKEGKKFEQQFEIADESKINKKINALCLTDQNLKVQIGSLQKSYFEKFLDGSKSGSIQKDLVIKSHSHFSENLKNEMQQTTQLNLVSKIQKSGGQTSLNTFSLKEIDDWLFNRKQDTRLPESKLNMRNKSAYAPTKKFNQLPMLGEGKYTSRMAVQSGSITDFKAEMQENAVIATSNNGDLLTGCGYAVAKAVVNAAGPGLQMDLYNTYGVPGVMETSNYGKNHYGATEGRGYALTCDGHDMRESHGINTIELLTVPMYSEEGLKNMYKEALEHSKDKDYIALPMAGMTHPVLNGNPKLSATIATEAAKEFIDSHPESKLKIIFTIFNNKNYESHYEDCVRKLS